MLFGYNDFDLLAKFMTNFSVNIVTYMKKKIVKRNILWNPLN